MARPGVNYQDIVVAVNALKGQGKNITIENIRAYLGTGSIGTVNKYLRQWRETEQNTSSLASKENLPEALVSMMKGLWEGVLTQSLQRFEPLEENYQQEISELKEELEKYRQNNQRWQKLFNQWQQEKTQLANDKLTLEQAIEFSHKENQSLLTKYDGMVQQSQEKQIRIDELHRLHQQTQANLEHYRESAREQRLLDQQQFEREKQQYLLEIKDLKEQLVSQQHRYSDLYQNNQLTERAFTDLQQEYQQSVKHITAINVKLDEMSKENIINSQASQHWQEQFKQSEQKLENKFTEVMSLQSDNKMLNQQLSDIKKLLQDTQDQNKLLAHEKWEVAQERAQLQGQIKQMQKSLVK